MSTVANDHLLSTRSYATSEASMEETRTLDFDSSVNRDAPLVFIPARLESRRLPRKPLIEIDGQPMIARVVEAVGRAITPQRIVVVSDTSEVLSASLLAQPQPGHTVLINHPCQSGSERVSRAYQDRFASHAPARGEWIINVQGDEPLLPAASLQSLIKSLPLFEERGVSIVTLAAPLESADAPSLAEIPYDAQRGVHDLMHDRAVVKACLTLGLSGSTDALTGLDGAVSRSHQGEPQLREALYFTRSPIGQHLHVGVYAFHTSALPLLSVPRGPLSLAEDLEQLTWMERGARIGVVCLAAPHPPGVDTPQDLERTRLVYKSLYASR